MFHLLARFSCTKWLSTSVSSYAFTPSLCPMPQLFCSSCRFSFLLWFLLFVAAVLVHIIRVIGDIFVCFFMFVISYWSSVPTPPASLCFCSSCNPVSLSLALPLATLNHAYGICCDYLLSYSPLFSLAYACYLLSRLCTTELIQQSQYGDGPIINEVITTTVLSSIRTGDQFFYNCRGEDRSHVECFC